MTRASSALQTASSASKTAASLASIARKELAMSKLKTAAIVIPVAVIAGWLWFGHSTPTASANTELKRPAVLVAPGRVEPIRDPVALAFETPGRIVAIVVDEGDVVK